MVQDKVPSGPVHRQSRLDLYPGEAGGGRDLQPEGDAGGVDVLFMAGQRVGARLLLGLQLRGLQELPLTVGRPPYLRRRGGLGHRSARRPQPEDAPVCIVIVFVADPMATAVTVKPRVTVRIAV